MKRMRIMGLMGLMGLITVQAQITDVNVGSAPDATDGDTIRNAFIKCNNDFTYIGGQLNTINSTLSGFSTEFDPFGAAYLAAFNGTNYTRYVAGTNTVAWLGCLNAESNVLQSDIWALTNNVNSLWTAMATAGNGAQMSFDKEDMLFMSQFGGPMWVTWITSDGFGTISAQQFRGNLVDAAGNGNWAIQNTAGYSVNQGSDITGFVPVSQNNGSWLWQALPNTLNLDSGHITSDGSGNASFVSLCAQQLKDSSGGNGSSGYFAQANGSGGWSWTAWPTTLNSDAGDLTSDGAGNITATGFRGSLLDNGNSSGASGSVPTANGDGSWTWSEGSVVPDSGGNGGMCLHLKASDNGQDMYLHVDSSGAITVTASP